jgi:hypothetical protein
VRRGAPSARAIALLLFAVCGGCLLRGAEDHPAIRFDAATQSVRARGLEPRLLAALAARQPEAPILSPAFAVYLGDARIPMLGDYQVDGETLRFTPRLPWLAGREYRATLDPRLLSQVAGLRPPAAGAIVRLSFRVAEPPALSASFRGPRGPGEPKGPRVVAAFPSGAVVPANLLRIYLHFSRPMSRRRTADAVRLLDDAGGAVDQAFLDVGDGLWDPAGRRLTLLLQPGRIKRGLALHRSRGLALRPGHRYRLIVSTAAEDEDGVRMAEPWSKELRVAAEDRRSPDPRRWALAPPPPGGRQALVVRVDKPLDEPLLARLLRVEDAAGRPVPGLASVEAEETRWRFVPRDPWREGDYVLRIGADLEDPAGNRPTRLFEEPAAADGRRAETRAVAVSFRIVRRPSD